MTPQAARPFQSALLKGVWPDVDNKQMRLIRRVIAQGFTQGKTTYQIVRELLKD
jgi:hypothetical protein